TTYVVEATFRRAVLDPDGVVLDIGRASADLRAVLAELDYRNLDEEPSLADLNTTTEALARLIADRLAERVSAGELDSLVVPRPESPVASASSERALCPSTSSSRRASTTRLGRAAATPTTAGCARASQLPDGWCRCMRFQVSRLRSRTRSGGFPTVRSSF